MNVFECVHEGFRVNRVIEYKNVCCCAQAFQRRKHARLATPCVERCVFAAPSLLGYRGAATASKETDGLVVAEKKQSPEAFGSSR